MKNELTERLRQQWTHDYRVVYERGEKALRDWTEARNIPHHYSINMTPHEHLIHAQGIWYDIDQRERYTKELWFYLIQRLNRKIDNNYQRKPHLTIQYQVVIEHYDKDTRTLIKPHLHGTLAVPDACHEQFKALLTQTSQGVNTINRGALKGATSQRSRVQNSSTYQTKTTSNTGWDMSSNNNYEETNMKINKASSESDIRKTNPSKVSGMRISQDDQNRQQALKDTIKMIESAAKRGNVTVVIAQI